MVLPPVLPPVDVLSVFMCHTGLGSMHCGTVVSEDMGHRAVADVLRLCP